MSTLRALKTRREGIEKINKIARAMEVIAATRLHRYEELVWRFRPYILAQEGIIQNLARRLKKINSLWVEPAAADSQGTAILVSADRGFCAGFNHQLLPLVKQLPNQTSCSFITIGKKGATLLKKKHYRIIEEMELPEEGELLDLVQRLATRIISAYSGQPQRVYLIFNKFRKNLLGRPTLQQVLPLKIGEEEGMVLDYLFEPEMQVVVEEILPVYVGSEIKAAILESKAAEEMARMVAMSQATRSAEDLIKSLNLQYHKARQAGITKELTEIVNAIR